MMIRRIYVGLVGLLLASGALQFYFAAVGAFTRPQTDDSYALHATNGRIVFPVLAILATIAAALAKAPGKLVAFTLAPLGLLVVQVLIIVLGNIIGGSTEQRTTAVSLAILGLHAVNGAFILDVTGKVMKRARDHLSAASAAK
ncbi:DUF6220 domain-containing protein [Allorhizocola rhizosphaerae]|uniref:DUF6220 domain-containing protein n=1 Tax=Allorhizocola rhizosphaerae TaxID=1872709 RepID=UPI001B8C1D26|nr:DUF6220 domain-containing protein [Allorhizocola rhizosphaerae]